MRPCLVTLALLLAASCLADCGGREGKVTVYFLRGGPSPVLEPVRRDTDPTAEAVLAELIRGPTHSEFRDGLRPVIRLPERSFTVHVQKGTAVVDYSGPDLTITASAALVFTLTRIDRVARVLLRRDGRACCVYYQNGLVLDPLTRRLFRGWSREPCALRGYDDAVACRA